MNNTLFSSKDMTWETPIEEFMKLNNEFHFTIDICASHHTAKCKRYYTEETDELSKDWSNEICWMNPPYGKDISLWMRKAYLESLRGATVVCLILARTDTRYWHNYCMRASEIRFVKGRLKFGNSVNSAPFPNAIVIFRPNCRELIINSYEKDIQNL